MAGSSVADSGGDGSSDATKHADGSKAAVTDAEGSRAGDARDGSPAATSDGQSDAGLGGRFRVLLFTRTTGFRHDSIPAAIAALSELGTTGGYVAEATEDPTSFSEGNLARFRVVVFLMTSGDVLDAAQQAVFEAWMSRGGSWVGVHSASDTEYNWPLYGSLVGAYFLRHPPIQEASVILENTSHPVLAGLPAPWVKSDEWYDFRSNPRAKVTVLATVDESSYSGGTMGDHPITWAHATSGGGRAFYTALGHGAWNYSDATFRRLLVQAIGWTAGR